jgi:large subunit ribosomal protein L23
MSELHLYDIIRRPVVTEKSQRLTDEQNVYVFEVDLRATKPMIKDAVETIFGVSVLKVRTMVMPAKRARRIRKTFFRTSEWKKAVVTIAPGQTIDLFNT